MMYADLIDLEDFTERLTQLGLRLPAGANEQRVKSELDCWLHVASDEELAAFLQLSTDLSTHYELLPAVASLLYSV